MEKYYEQRASSGLIITEATAISEDGSGWRNAPHIRTEAHAEAWKPIVDKVHEKGGVIFMQLWHMGRQAHSSHHPNTKRIVSASDIPMQGQESKTIYGEPVEAEVPHALTLEEIEQTIQDFVNAAKLAKQAGFDGIELHSANGYLFDQFFQSCSNKRVDKYGGSIENRTRLLVDVVEAIIASEAFPASRIAFRMSPNGVYGGMGSEDNFEQFTYIAKKMNSYGLAYLHIMDGLGFGYHGKCKAVTCADIRKVFDGPIIANVGLTRDVAEGLIRSGACDAAAFGRIYISNPDLVERFANNWPVEESAAYETWWGATAEKGYTDFPVYEGTEREES
jgi:2,4-dienoyl-CoA reductase-like NADH-dependent reductase (Old Yellow Enzyme family)